MANQSATDSDRAQGDDAQRPVPVRYWWLKRITVTAALLVAALVGLRCVLTWRAEARLRQRIEQIRAAGEPILLEDFVQEPLEAEQNAATYYRRAAAAMASISLTSDEQSVYNAIDYDRVLSEKEVAVLRKVVNEGRAALIDIRAARGRKDSDWGGSLTNFNFARYQQIRELAWLLRVAAVTAHRDGDDAEAVERIRDGLHLIGSMGPEPLLTSYFTGLGIGAMSAGTVRQLWGDLAVAADGQQPTTATAAVAPSAQPALRQKVLALIAELLDDTAAREHLIYSLQGERARLLDAVRGQLDAPVTLSNWWCIPDQAVTWFLRPHIVSELLKADAYLSATIEFGRQQDDAARRAAMAATTVPTDTGIPQADIVRSFLPVLGRVPVQHCWSLADRRMAAILLAIRLYEIDHTGKRPGALTDLVPQYLASVPADPFAGDGRAIGYVVDAAHPFLYSVGEDGRDDVGGGWRPTFPSSSVNARAPDLVHFLELEPAAPSE